MMLVAISASYGAGGSRVAPAVAERLGVPFLDRAIPLAVAERLDVTPEEAAEREERGEPGLLERLLSGFIGQDAGTPVPVPAEQVNSEDFRRATEEVLLAQAATGGGVILGRGAVVVLRDDPRVLRVRLDGPADRRIQQAIELQGLDRETAERSLRQIDHAHETYVRRFYGERLDNLALYHLVLDSTALPIDACVELIALAVTSWQPERAAAQARARTPEA